MPQTLTRPIWLCLLACLAVCQPALLPAAAEEAAAALAAVDQEFGRTTDPVRMYMREMGTVDLLTREGEIKIAKRIEEGLGQVLTALVDFPSIPEFFLDQYALSLKGEAKLTDIMSGFIDLSAEAAVPQPPVSQADKNSGDKKDDEEGAEDLGKASRSGAVISRGKRLRANSPFARGKYFYRVASSSESS